MRKLDHTRQPFGPLSVSPVGELVLADDIFWLFHDEGSGRARVPARTAGTAVAAGLLAELFARGSLAISAPVLRPGSPGTRDAIDQLTLLPEAPEAAGWVATGLDAAEGAVLSRVRAEPELHPLRDWLAVLSLEAIGLVGRRMVAQGAAVDRQVRRGLRRDVVFLPVDPIAAAWPAARLSTGVRGHRNLDAGDVFLLGLAAATPLADDLLADAPAPLRDRALGQQDELPGPWRVLLDTTRVAVASGVMTQRT
jgi:hypothetical protein